ncbi:MAG: cyclic nucleotide-binding domain-containing protein [Proteobacteria bacterium]|nr:cyclic nucleotide-binding domain-containing protein [Pseudomonadota bacterium]
MRVRSGGCSSSDKESRDCWGIDPSGSFFVLAAGTGNEGGGALASRRACEGIIKALIPHREQIEHMAADTRPDARQMLVSALCGAMIRAEKDLFEIAEQTPRYKCMATTCDLVFLANGTAYICHIGDSRVYLLRGDTGRQLTVDHNVCEYLRAQGKKEEELVYHSHKNRFTRALGMGGGAEIDTLQVSLRQGDRLVICTDGLHRHFQNATHLAQLYRSVDPQRAAEFLVSNAIERGSSENVSVICVEITDPGVRRSALETDSRITALEQICFFRDLSYQEMLQVMPITFERTIEPGFVIIQEGDAGEELYILVEGECEVTNSGVKLATLEAGSSFGELSLIDRQPRSATVTAITMCRVLAIRASDFEKLTASGTLAVKLLWNVVHELSEQLRRSSDTIRKQGMKLLEKGIQ